MKNVRVLTKTEWKIRQIECKQTFTNFLDS